MSFISSQIKEAGYIHPLADDAADEIEQLESKIAQMETKLAEAKKEALSAQRDQERYQWLRQKNWCDSDLCVVTKPRANLKLGAYCPSLEFLDDVIDAAIASIQESEVKLSAVPAQELVKQESWLPIETAPKGKKIIVKYKNACEKDRTVFAKYIERFTEESTYESDCDEYNDNDDTHYLKEGWVELIDNWDEFSSVYFDSANIPTGWMPAPPVKEVTE